MVYDLHISYPFVVIVEDEWYWLIGLFTKI